jgi:beta-glucosidase-like glycosyl hydrolase
MPLKQPTLHAWDPPPGTCQALPLRFTSFPSNSTLGPARRLWDGDLQVGGMVLSGTE